MNAPNGNSPVVELKQQLVELKQSISAAVSGKAEAATVAALQAQVDAIDVKLAGNHFSGSPAKSLADELKENESLSRLMRDRKGRAVLKFEGKSVISAIASGSINGDALAPVGTMTTGVLPIDRIPGITAEARQVLKVRDVLTSRPTAMQVVDFVKVQNPMAIASPVPEASVKPENAVTFVSSSERVKTLATWIPATRQVLDDFQELMNFLQGSLGYYVSLAEELQILAGDNIGDDLHGLIPQAATLSSAYLPSASSGYNRIDIIAAACEQIDALKEIPPTFAIVNPSDWWRMRLIKDGFGRYILGEPAATVRPTIFGLNIVPTTSMPVGYFLVGSGDPAAAEIRDRQELVVEISTEHASFFTENLVAIRAEKRLALVVKRNNSFVSGTFVTSPVGQ